MADGDFVPRSTYRFTILLILEGDASQLAHIKVDNSAPCASGQALMHLCST